MRASLGRTAGLALLSGLVTACSLLPAARTDPTPPAVERMPSPASIWLTSDPESPSRPVRVRLRVADGPKDLRDHTFVAGTPLRGSFPLSEGRFRLIGLEDACAVDVFLRPDREMDMTIQIGDDGGCAFAVGGEHRLVDVEHNEPSILVAP